MTERQFVCEGACNPGIKQLDSEVAELRRQELYASERGWTPRLPDEIEARLRALHHTPHFVLSPSRACCGVCGHTRRHHLTNLERVRTRKAA